MRRSSARPLWPIIRRVWVTVGSSAGVVFIGWSLIAYRATPEAHAALASDSASVIVRHEEGVWRFDPPGGRASAVGLLFFAGALVDPVAHAPLARAVAADGFPARLIELPRRGAFGGADDPVLATRARALMSEIRGPRRWVLAGHSRGAVVATNLAAERPEGMAGLVLIGSSHPRDLSLAGLTVPVTKIVGTRDGLASPEEVEANRHLLPAATRWVRIDGANHSQFGWYGFQPGDRRATISGDSQKLIMLRVVREALHAAAL